MAEHYTGYFDYHVALLQQFRDRIQTLPPYHIDLAQLTDTDYAVMQTLDNLCQRQHFDEQMSEQGQWLIERIITGYNHLLQHLPRDLLWFFGGSCLHYMPDEEIRFYQQLDELRYAAEEQQRPFSIVEAKTFLQSNAP